MTPRQRLAANITPYGLGPPDMPRIYRAIERATDYVTRLRPVSTMSPLRIVLWIWVAISFGLAAIGALSRPH